MTKKEIRHIICAVRGVPKSRDTVTKAIDLALEHQARLTFVHVTNLDFLGPATPAMTPISAVEKQIKELSEFTMVVLCDRAQRRGVQDVDFIVRQRGEIFQQLSQILSETRPDLLVIGKPIRKSTDPTSLEPDELSIFIQEVEQDLFIPVISVEIEISD